MRMHILSTRVFFRTPPPPIKSENAVPHVRVYFSPKIGGWGSQNKPSSRGGIKYCPPDTTAFDTIAGYDNGGNGHDD